MGRPYLCQRGKWIVSFSWGKLDTFGSIWQLLALIGEQFDCGDEICGTFVNVRARQEKIALWTKNAANEAAQILSTLHQSLVAAFVTSFVDCTPRCEMP